MKADFVVKLYDCMAVTVTGANHELRIPGQPQFCEFEVTCQIYKLTVPWHRYRLLDGILENPQVACKIDCSFKRGW